MERDRRKEGKAEASSPGTTDGLAISAEVVAPLGATSLSDVRIFITKGWTPICFTLLKLSLRGIPFLQDAELADQFCATLDQATRLTKLDLTKTGLSSRHLSAVCRTVSTTLETLLVGENPFQIVPAFIGRLKKLRTLNIMGSKVEFLSSAVRDLVEPSKEFLELEMYPCPQLQMIPSKVQSKGAKAIRDHLRKPGPWTPRSRQTIVLLGHSESGKTTLVSALDNVQNEKFKDIKKALGTPLPPRPKPREREGSTVNTLQLQSTVGVRQTTWDLLSAEVGGSAVVMAKPELIQTTVLDFAGQLEYLTTHKFFLPVVDTSYLIVSDVMKSYDEQLRRVKHWVSLLDARFSAYLHDPDHIAGFCRPTFAVILVGTKRDLYTGSEQQLKANISGLAKYIASSSIGPYFVRNTHIVSSLTRSGLEGLLAEIIRQSTVLLKQGSELPSVGRIVSKALEQLRENGRHVVTDEAIKAEMSSIDDATPISEFLFQSLLEYFAGRGLIIRHNGSSVWTNPVLIARIMSLFISPLSHQMTFLRYMNVPLQGRAVVTLTDACNRLRTISSFKSLDMRLCKQLLDSLQELDICFEIDKKAWKYFGTTEAYFFPSLRPRGQLRIFHPCLPSPFGSDSQLDLDPSPPPSPVIPHLSPSFYSGRAFSFGVSHLAVEMFFYLQVNTREMLDYRYKIYYDSFFLSAPDGSRALVSLDEPDQFINVVCLGPRTSQLLAQVVGVMSKLAKATYQEVPIHILCPCCIQGIGLFPALSPTNECERGHKFTADRVAEPVPAAEEFAYLNELWAPLRSQLPKVGSWSSTGPLRHTVLAQDVSKKAREEEYLRAKDLFYRFTGRDPLSLYELDKVVFLMNENLEKAFAREYMEMIEKHSRVASPEMPRVPGPDEELAQRDWVMSNFRNYCLSIPSNENVNLIAGWHGTTEEVCFKIATNNFHAPDNQPASQQHDPGYYGKGIYFTQFPSYSAKYNTGSTKCLMLSWLLMGRVYPVIENPNGKNNLVGKPRMSGFDSHYVVVKKMNDLVYFPCKPGEKAEYDELVVFRQSQILPRYIFYYRVAEASPASQIIPGSARLTASASTDVCSARTILWVDDKAHGEHTLLMQMWRKEFPSIAYMALSSTEELQVWLRNRSTRLAAIGGDSALRIITNRYRERDGGAAAAELLVSWIRKESPFKKTRVLVFCSNPVGLEHLLDQHTTCTHDGSVCRKFASWSEP